MKHLEKEYNNIPIKVKKRKEERDFIIDIKQATTYNYNEETKQFDSEDTTFKVNVNGSDNTYMLLSLSPWGPIKQWKKMEVGPYKEEGVVFYESDFLGEIGHRFIDYVSDEITRVCGKYCTTLTEN